LYFLDSEVDAETACVLVSRSGESVEITRLLKRIQGRSAISVGVTNIPESGLAREVNRPILIASPPDEFVAIQTYTATVATFALLHAAMRDQLSVAAQELQATAEALSRWIAECVYRRDQWDGFLNSTGPYYLLGRGPGLGSVAEGVLLLHEIAKHAAVGMSIAQFRHGPIEVVDSAFHAIVFGTQPQTAELDAALANDLIVIGGTVRWLGPPVPGCTAPLLCNWPAGVPKQFWSLIETIPLQCLAYRKAELMGVHPGEFRWAPQVTTAESGFPTLRMKP
jgi:glucosamine--fructose-6-phosphate aminotransferase (isomerizing)